MVDKAKLMERLMATFLDELDEHVRTINSELMALEKDPADDEGGERLKRLFRAAHSLKGASRAVDLPAIEQVCHQMEDVFSGFRDGRLSPSSPVCSVLFEVADAIEAAGMQLREKSPVDNRSLEALLPRLDTLAGDETDAARPSSPAISEPAGENADADAAVEDAGLTEASVPPPADSPPGGRRALPTTVRVAEEKLDSLLAQSGELLVARQCVESRANDLDPLRELIAEWRAEWRNVSATLLQLAAHGRSDPLMRRSARLRERVATAIEHNGERLTLLEERLESFRQQLVADSRQLKLASVALQEDIHRVRMLPFAEACAGLERAVRDICSATDKEVELVIDGGDLEVDRSVLEGLSDPLLHLVRNAVDHGVETPDERRRLGKPLPATVTVKAVLHGAEIDVVVSDDGGGLNLEKIRRRVRSRKLPEPANDRELARCIFLPGFSTADVVTDVSGRGVGMDVVKSRIESLHGRVDISSEPGLGTRFVLSVPLTLTTISALFVGCSGQTFAFPTSTVSRLVRFDPTQLRMQQGEAVLPLGGAPVRTVSLAGLLDLPPAESDTTHAVGVLASVAEHQLLLVVDEVIAEHEAVVKTLGRRIQHVPHVSGAITMRSGRFALLLNTSHLMRTVASGGADTFAPVDPGDAKTSGPDEPAGSGAGRVLVVDDSMTTRMLLKSILETADYEVSTAADGQEAWLRLQSEPVDVIVTDVDMPRMSGFELTERIRRSPERGQLPVILVTSRESDADKARGVEVGADAYLVKSSFDQTTILETVEQFL